MGMDRFYLFLDRPGFAVLSVRLPAAVPFVFHLLM
jgi:hypothetical protein